MTDMDRRGFLRLAADVVTLTSAAAPGANP